MIVQPARYRGRFAPSPTGPLHLGSLLAALVSYLEARRHGGEWWVRIEDLDPPRTQPGASDAILRSLEAHALLWDSTVMYQSQRSDAYQQAIERLSDRGQLFWCRCSRKQLAGHRVYPGTCRACRQPRSDAAIRFQAPEVDDAFTDLFQGAQHTKLASDYGDVVVRRRDGLFAYQLAVVVDDCDQGMTDIVRGIDLLSSTFWQRALYRALGQPCPNYAHFPVLVHAGQKLSKQNFAPALDDHQAINNLMQLWPWLGLAIERDTPERMLVEASKQWSPACLKARQELPL
ncbi:tRNA glutamyl-Q(34) synthetase GluQRS [Saccharospirillum impatiens]|uniref:tRNA glutamyl-Q(34) synthetase GluQRS n=1 Tax=Saccharospirillum impatiens TaxID=169438 RepID=UPI0004200F9B|nr:tRNA glutamyl-Q(34) synthetase GluQRS [Saccharospirillum impatiens]